MLDDESFLSPLCQILTETLSLRDMDIDTDTVLLGGIPEFDSMAVVTVIGALEDHFGIEIYDDEISAEVFESVGSLLSFVQQKTT